LDVHEILAPEIKTKTLALGPTCQISISSLHFPSIIPWWQWQVWFMSNNLNGESFVSKSLFLSILILPVKGWYASFLLLTKIWKRISKRWTLLISTYLSSHTTTNHRLWGRT